MPRVIVRRATYHYEVLSAQVFAILDALGGAELLKENSRVLIKPNLLAPASPDKALTTNPAMVRAVVEYVVQKRAIPRIADSPAMGSLEKVLQASGIKKALEGLDVDYRPFQTSLPVSVGQPFNKIEIAEDALQCDVLINLPKLKTHSQMLLTLGVKNLFGCIVGFKKPEWHLRAGADRDLFARLLVHIYQILRPQITILDGILAMEGQGPGMSGTPIQLDMLVGSDDALALDMTVCRILGLNPQRVFTNRVAEQMGLASSTIEVEGDHLTVSDFKLPQITPVVFGPHLFHGFMRKHLIQRPVSSGHPCKLCGECWNYCPAQAIAHDRKKVIFDYDRCIRCYCCIEVCPHGLLKTEEPLLGKAFRNVLGAWAGF